MGNLLLSHRAWIHILTRDLPTTQSLFGLVFVIVIVIVIALKLYAIFAFT